MWYAPSAGGGYDLKYRALTYDAINGTITQSPTTTTLFTGLTNITNYSFVSTATGMTMLIEQTSGATRTLTLQAFDSTGASTGPAGVMTFGSGTVWSFNASTSGQPFVVYEDNSAATAAIKVANFDPTTGTFAPTATNS